MNARTRCFDLESISCFPEKCEEKGETYASVDLCLSVLAKEITKLKNALNDQKNFENNFLATFIKYQNIITNDAEKSNKKWKNPIDKEGA